jgi:hypothetical protein
MLVICIIRYAVVGCPACLFIALFEDSFFGEKKKLVINEEEEEEIGHQPFSIILHVTSKAIL